MKENNHLIIDYDAVLDVKYGVENSPERIKAEDKAFVQYIGQVIANIRKERKMSQDELAQLTGYSRPLISRIENGTTNPKASKFHRIMSALGYQIEYIQL